MSSHWSSCPLIGHHVLSLVIMSSHWSSCPLIGSHVLYLVLYRLIGSHVLSWVIMCSHWLSCPLIGHKHTVLVGAFWGYFGQFLAINLRQWSHFWADLTSVFSFKWLFN